MEKSSDFSLADQRMIQEVVPVQLRSVSQDIQAAGDKLEQDDQKHGKLSTTWVSTDRELEFL